MEATFVSGRFVVYYRKNWLRLASKNTGSMIYAILTSSMLSGLEMT